MVKYIEGTTEVTRYRAGKGINVSAKELFDNWDTIVYPSDKRICKGFKIGRYSRVYSRIISISSNRSIFWVQSDFKTGLRSSTSIKISPDHMVTVLYNYPKPDKRKIERLETTEQLSARIFPLRNHCMAGREQIVNYFNR